MGGTVCARAVTGLVVLVLVALVGCGKHGADGAKSEAIVTSVARAAAAPAAFQPGDASRGEALVRRFECNRCHDGTGTGRAPLASDCVGCHRDILAGSSRSDFGKHVLAKAPAATLARWRTHVAPLHDAPSLANLGNRLRPEWIERYLLAPHDLRPNLVPTMPRLALSAEQAKDVATYLVRDAEPAAPVSLAGADAAHGRKLLEERACGGCHVMTGVPAFPVAPAALDAAGVARTEVALAPDLRFVRERYAPSELVAWLVDPSRRKPGTPMPAFGFTEAEARDVAAYLLQTALDVREPTVAAPLPLLDRRVTYDEVYERVFKRTCRHCHADPDETLGDGGPGSTGGFGFAGKRLDLSSYRGASAGLVGADGERHSVFERGADGSPLLVAVLTARQHEEAGRIEPAVRGMPLGLPPLPPEDVQLVATWVAQGRPR